MASPGTARVALFRSALGSAETCVNPLEAVPVGDAAAPLSFESVYEEHLAFVWRSLQRLGLRGAAIPSATAPRRRRAAQLTAAPRCAPTTCAPWASRSLWAAIS